MTVRTEGDNASQQYRNSDCCINGQLLKPVPCKVAKLEHGRMPAARLAVKPGNLIAAV